jgi:N-dimethylarginine dimethylaminohydrolase
MTTPSNASVYLVSPPRPDWGIRGRANVFAAAAASPSAAAALVDWIAVCDAIEGAGGVCAVVDNDVDATLTGLPYCAEAGLCGRDPETGAPVFVLPNLTPPHRQPEPLVIAPAVARLGLFTERLPADVPFEGQGDVIRIGDRSVCTGGVGPWARTSPEAAVFYRDLLPGPWLTLTFHADPWFHGNTFLGGYVGGGDALVLVCDDALLGDGPSLLRQFVDGARVLPLSRDDTLCYPTNALQVGDVVLAPAGVPGFVVDAWRALGLTVRFLELPALFRQGGGAAVCLTNRLDGVVAAAVPDDMRLSAWKERQP